jgi:hypothetical protein
MSNKKLLCDQVCQRLLEDQLALSNHDEIGIEIEIDLFIVFPSPMQ